MSTTQFLGGRIILGTEFAGYKWKFFEPGTSTLKTTFKDSSLTAGNENTSTVVADANGAAQIWYSGNADVVFYTPADVVVYSDDDINLESSNGNTGSYNSALNGSFEDDADGDGIPDSWTRTLYTGGTFLLDTTTQSHGDTSAKFTSTGTGGGYLTSTTKFPVKASEMYELSWDMKSSVADVRNLVQIFWYQANGSASATASVSAYDDSATNPTSWTKKTYNATAPNDAYFAELRLTGCHSSDSTSGNTHFDNVQFLESKVYGSKLYSGAVSFENTVNYAATSGTDTYTATLSPAITSYVTGAHYFISFGNANTSTTPTLNLNGLGAKTIVKDGSSALLAGDIPAGHKTVLIYDGTNLVITNPKVQTTATQGSSLVLLSAQTISAQAACNFTSVITSTYDNYLLLIDVCSIATANQAVIIEGSKDNGSNWEATNYTWGAVNAAGGASTYIDLTLGTTMGTNLTNSYFFGRVEIFSPLSTTAPKGFGWHVNFPRNADAAPFSAAGSGTWTSTGAGNFFNAFRVRSTSGNISGIFKLYGIKKA